jgi:hypothetical protein
MQEAVLHRLNHHTTINIHRMRRRYPMNQHQFPPCLLAILFIRRNVPPRKVDVDENASF